ncbi:forkhead box protein N3-like isoform X1 [Anguilla rostrata]|uniref:forkhead box protein N3-like isoform X1 n=1 Tax=Anguilla rostrata TaxID=7938 RepID=UPI0030D0B7EC
MVMPPSKKSEVPRVSVVSGRSLFDRVGSPQDVTVKADPAAPGPRPEDEELTNLNWLHESSNLLNSFGDQVLRSVSPVMENDCGDGAPPSPSPPPAPSDPSYDLKQNPNCKPPYSFSCLIFMAIEDSPSKRLPVKDIYNWILHHFPYFANAPTGWKNSVRHNLSLNKCFKKVDKDRSQSMGKGSLWCIEAEYRQNLIQALKKTPFHPHAQVLTTPSASLQAYQSISSPPLWPVSPFFRRNGGVLLQVPQGVIQNGARMMSQDVFPGIRPLPIIPIGSRSAAVSRSVLGVSRKRSESDLSCDSPLVSSDPKEDHTYSSAKSSGLPSLEGGASHEGGDAPSDAEDDDRVRVKRELKDLPPDSSHLAQYKRRLHWTKAKLRLSSDSLPLKKRRTQKPPESDDEEMKEAAGSLLHLAGVRACLNNITNRTAKGQKEQKDTLKN